jgi:poly(hydroxyalkanoate) depolymerase family esterase
MHQDFQRLMNDAAALVRAGDLTAATAAIQAALAGQGTVASSPVAAPSSASDIVIDVEAREIDALPVDDPVQEAPVPEPLYEAPAHDAPGSFIAGRFGEGRNARDYKLYVPPQAGTRPLPLVVMLHGCTQDPDDFARGTQMNQAAREAGCFVLYPAQSAQANPQRCWNWFKHNHQERGRGEPAQLAALTRHVMARHAIDPARVFVAGLSAGGAMAAILGQTHPELFAAVGVHSGLAPGAARDLPSALAAMREGGRASARIAVPVIVFHGDADPTVHASNGAHVIAASAAGAGAQGEADAQAANGKRFTRHIHRSAAGEVAAEHWIVHGGGHAWAGGSLQGSHADPQGPDATREMLRFFLEHPRA